MFAFVYIVTYSEVENLQTTNAYWCRKQPKR